MLSAVAVVLVDLLAPSQGLSADAPRWVPPKLDACTDIHLYGSCCCKHDINIKVKAGKRLRKVAGSFSVFESNLLYWGSSWLERLQETKFRMWNAGGVFWSRARVWFSHRSVQSCKWIESNGLGEGCIFLRVKWQISKRNGKGGFVHYSIWYTIYDGDACKPGFGGVTDKTWKFAVLCTLFELAIWMTFCDLSISTSRGCLFSQGRHFSLEKPVWTINTNVPRDNLFQLNCRQIVNRFEKWSIKYANSPPASLVSCLEWWKRRIQIGFCVFLIPRMHVSNMLYLQNWYSG